MTKEIEIKVLNIDLDDMERKLKELGAKLISKEYQKNIILDSKDRYIERELNSYLRIRETKNLLTNETIINLTLKKNVSRDGARKNIEITTRIDDIGSMISILKDLKYEIMEEGYKERRSYLYEKIRFDLDKWDKETYPFPYMEIEVEKEEDLNKAIYLLNINRNNITTKSIMELKEEL
ncbi:class IV adenylate cyclase [Clostridium sp. Cult1]|uniref:class IV adenylate cyclase n=1 Tax=Clostridium sp. Cult1 TaxID=2079002 RepID=UPI001F27F944|nr:class IV adenylate cyclase [Clostridium sp. Cult1]MCF6463564.1 adenylate cyclase [Clostridium sp. Cult1]